MAAEKAAGHSPFESFLDSGSRTCPGFVPRGAPAQPGEQSPSLTERLRDLPSGARDGHGYFVEEDFDSFLPDCHAHALPGERQVLPPHVSD